MQGKETYSHFERVRILSARALQISQGAPILVKIPKDMITPVDIAKIEWDKEVIPIESRRRF